MNKYALLGAGMMGQVAAKDLLDADDRSSVTLIDGDQAQLVKASELTGRDRVQFKHIDISDRSATAQALKGHTAAISALPHSMSLESIKVAIEAKVPLVDLVCEAPEERAALHEAARAAGVLIIPGCGVAPGISNICVGRGMELLDETQNAVIYVGGIPKEKGPPLDYQTVYLLESVFNLYLRPAEIVQDGKRVTVEALSGVEEMVFDEPIGRLEAFNSNGLGSLALTMGDRVKCNLFEKTLRYPGHVEKFQLLKNCGLLETKPVRVGDVEVSPFRFLEQILGPKLQLGAAGDILVMRVLVDGVKDGKHQQHVFELIDYFDSQTGYTAMARTTSFPATCAARMIAAGELTETGVWFPEQVFLGDRFEKLVIELSGRNVTLSHEEIS
ncbi:MAG: L-lysine dehydrogenase [Planctomycetes bacterium]|nr:L-lysine dehydrogenase [Planctomycetota bacterium]